MWATQGLDMKAVWLSRTFALDTKPCSGTSKMCSSSRAQSPWVRYPNLGRLQSRGSTTRSSLYTYKSDSGNRSQRFSSMKCTHRSIWVLISAMAVLFRTPPVSPINVPSGLDSQKKDSVQGPKGVLASRSAVGITSLRGSCPTINRNRSESLAPSTFSYSKCGNERQCGLKKNVHVS